MLALLLESALRVFVLSAAVWLVLRILRIRNVHAEITAWRTVLIVSLAMPLLVQFVAPLARVTIPAPAPSQMTAPVAEKIDTKSPTAPTQLPDSVVEPAVAPASPLADSEPSAIEPTPTPTHSAIDWQNLLTAVYLAVATVLLVRPLIGVALIFRLMRAARPLDEGWTAECDVRLSDDITMPVTFGGIILLPIDCADWSVAKRQAVVAHEKSHVDHGDFWIMLLASLNRAVFWFNPLSWWLLRRLTELAEIISDDAAIEAIGDQPAYAEFLLDVASHARPIAAGVAMARPRTLRRRIERILAATGPSPRMTRRKRILSSLALLPAAAMSVITIARGSPPTDAIQVSAVQVAPGKPSKQVTIGFLNDLSPDQWGPALSGFRRGLGEAGYVDGENVAFAYRWTEGHRNHLPELAADLAQSNVAVIVASGDTPAALAAKAATSKIPILFAIEDDPVRFGLAASLDKPGGNATGMYLDDPTFGALSTTRNMMLRQLVPNLGPMFWTIQIFDAHSYPELTDPEAALANKLGTIRTNTGPVPPDIKSLLQTDPAAALKKLYERMGPATTPSTVSMVRSLEIISGPFLDSSRQKQAVALAARHGIPTLYHWRAFVEAGGLMSYGLDIDEVYAQMGRYAGEILKGNNPAEMPIVKPTKSETVINLRAAADLGLNIPPALLARADKVIQ